jgi:hypothetical protein
VRGGRIGGRHTRRPPRRLAVDNERSGHLVGTEHTVGIRLNEVRRTLVLLILAALTPYQRPYRPCHLYQRHQDAQPSSLTVSRLGFCCWRKPRTSGQLQSALRDHHGLHAVRGDLLAKLGCMDPANGFRTHRRVDPERTGGEGVGVAPSRRNRHNPPEVTVAVPVYEFHIGLAPCGWIPSQDSEVANFPVWDDAGRKSVVQDVLPSESTLGEGPMPRRRRQTVGSVYGSCFVTVGKIRAAGWQRPRLAAHYAKGCGTLPNRMGVEWEGRSR